MQIFVTMDDKFLTLQIVIFVKIAQIENHHFLSNRSPNFKFVDLKSGQSNLKVGVKPHSNSFFENRHFFHIVPLMF